MALDAFTKLRLADVGQLVACKDESGVREELDSMLESIYDLMSGTSNAIYNIYFTHVSNGQRSMGFQPQQEL
jgi:hypothetical protein